MKPSILRAALAMFAVLLAGCDRSSDDVAVFEDDSGILQYIPADSAYAYVRLEPMPDELTERFAAVNAAALAHNQAMMGELAEVMPDDEEAAKAIRQLVELAQDLSSPGGMERIGIDPVAPYAVYDIDLVPVFRAGLNDPDALAEIIANLETAFDFEAEQSTLGDVDYSYFDFDGVRLIWVTSGSSLVVTVSHADASDESLSAQLGITAPSENMAESGELAAIAGEFGFMPQGMGFMDTLRFIDGVFDPGGLLGNLAGEQPEALTDACRAEIRSAVGNVPRVAVGVTRADAAAVEGSMVVVLRDALASDLQGLTAAVPGLGQSATALFSGGFSFDASVARKFVENRLAEMAESPFECEFLANGNEAIDQAQAFLNRQPLPPTLYDLRGMYMSVDGIDVQQLMQQQPPESAEVDVILAMKNPESLTAMGALFVPGFAELGLKQDGELREIPDGVLNPTGMPLWVAMTDERLSLSLGSEAQERLSKLMALQANRDAPLTHFDFNAGAYFALMSDMMPVAQQQDTIDLDTTAALMDAMADAYDRLDISLDVHEKGLIFTSGITLK
ncbi:MAG: hypothetical protein AAF660_04985 [Pseudomonadota bacterium]